jgi:peptidoglycan hydrolase-like protein with peptidoglycan-binding domain
MLKNKLFAGAIFALALFVAGTVSAAYTFPNKIDTLQEKKDVQTVLNMNGANLTVDGILGAKSISAIKTFQGSKGLEADGLIGPMTRAALEAASVSGSVSTVPGCAAGALFSATSGAACTTVSSTVPGCTAGALFSATTGASCATGVVTTPGATGVLTGTTDGSLQATTSSFISSGITMKKGETKDVAAVRLQALVGPVKVSRVDVTFNTRPWLLFSQVTLKDNNGAILATKSLSSIADVTELTVGTLYQVRFDNLSYIVTPGTNADLAVSATVLSATDKITAGMPVIVVGIPSLRTINAIGYSETIGFAGLNSVFLSEAGSVASIYTRISPASPIAGQQVVSLTETTPNAILGVFSLKSVNTNSTLNSLKVKINGTAAITSLVNTTTNNVATNFSNFRLFIGGTQVAGGSLDATTGIVTFSNLSAPFAVDAWTDLTIKADIAMNVSGTVYASLDATVPANIVATDVNYNTSTVISNTANANTLTLTVNSLTLSAASATLGSAITNTNSTVGNNATYMFTLTNNSNNDLFVSTTALSLLTMTSSGSSTLASVIASPSSVNGDLTIANGNATNVSFAIPAGTARTFTVAGALRGTGTTVTYAATAINYGITAASPTGLSIISGLSALSLTASY